MGMDCCPKKKIWGSMNQKMDGMYVNVGKMPWGKLPMRCNSDCVYEREGSYDGLKYCFGDSMYSQSECAADMGDGEEPVDMGPGDGSGSGGMGGGGSGSGGMGSDYGSGSGGMGGYGSGSGGMGSDYGSGSGGMGGYGSGSGGMGSGSDGENPVDMGPGSESGFEGYGSGTMGPGSGSGSEDPVNMGSGSENEDPVTMGPGSGSGSASGASCPEKVLMSECDIDCLDATPDPMNPQQLFTATSESEGGVTVFITSWTILADNPVSKITLTCTGAPAPMVTECKDGGWTIPEEIRDRCGGMEGYGSGSGSGDDGMMDHGSGSGSGDDGMMDHGSGSGDDGMMDHGSGSGSGEDGMMDHGSSSGSEDGGMGDHGSGDGGMGDHNGRQ